MQPQLWPSAEAYAEAVADPAAILDPQLRDAVVARGSGLEPRTYTGTFAAVFRLHAMHGDVALRCFTRARCDLARRYAAIGEFLSYVRSDALVRTRFDAEALRVHGEHWPAVIMSWVDGVPLDVEIARRLHDGDALLALAEDFREVVRSLGALGIAHGDLQHGNVLVTRDGLRLIDYDAMYLPALADVPQVEFGHRNYQHPQRRDAPFNARLDRFSSLVIYTALVALAADPSLWRFHDGDNVLFRAHDFTSDGRSELVRALLANNAASTLANVVVDAARRPIADVPTLEAAIAAAAGTMPAHQPMPPPRPAPPRPAPTRPAPPPFAVPQAPSSRPTRRPASPSLALVVPAALIAGLTLGTAVALRTQHPASIVAHAPSAPVAHRTSSAPVAHRTASSVVASERATSAAHAAPATRGATPHATPPGTPTTGPSAPSASATPASANVSGFAERSAGTWELAESNRFVGTIVWSGAGDVGRGAMQLAVRKASVAGRAATPCERATVLRVTLATDRARQVVPFSETNCAGATSGGEIRISRVAADGGSFDGSVWQGGANIGAFTATKR